MRLEVSDIAQLPRLVPLSWSRYRLDRLEQEFRFVQEVGPAAQLKVGDVGWTGDELIAFRVHLPSRISFHNSPLGVERGNILVWEQTASRSAGGDAASHGSADGNRVDSLPDALALRRNVHGGNGGAGSRYLVGQPQGKERSTCMSSFSFGAKPAVLRCSRCGTFVDWADARAQVVCECRPRIELPPVLVREAADAERAAALELFRRDFGRSGIVAFGQLMDLDASPALVAEMNGEVAGALAYRLVDTGLHIVALATDPMWQRSGVGGYLVAEAELLARRLKIPRVIVSMTNDNLPSLYFYQRRGYYVSEWIPNGAAKLSKSASLAGFGGIPIRDEVRLEKTLALLDM